MLLDCSLEHSDAFLCTNCCWYQVVLSRSRLCAIALPNQLIDVGWLGDGSMLCCATTGTSFFTVPDVQVLSHCPFELATVHSNLLDSICNGTYYRYFCFSHAGSSCSQLGIKAGESHCKLCKSNHTITIRSGHFTERACQTRDSGRSQSLGLQPGAKVQLSDTCCCRATCQADPEPCCTLCSAHCGNCTLGHQQVEL